MGHHAVDHLRPGDRYDDIQLPTQVGQRSRSISTRRLSSLPKAIRAGLMRAKLAGRPRRSPDQSWVSGLEIAGVVPLMADSERTRLMVDGRSDPELPSGQ